MPPKARCINGDSLSRFFSLSLSTCRIDVLLAKVARTFSPYYLVYLAGTFFSSCKTRAPHSHPFYPDVAHPFSPNVSCYLAYYNCRHIGLAPAAAMFPVDDADDPAEIPLRCPLTTRKLTASHGEPPEGVSPSSYETAPAKSPWVASFLGGGGV